MTDSRELTVGIIGCGLIGQKRAQNLLGAKLADFSSESHVRLVVV